MMNFNTRLLSATALWFALATPAGAVSIPVTADAMVRQSLPNQTYGTTGQLAIDTDTSSYLYFDLTSALPVGTPSSLLQKATLYLYAGTVTSPGKVALSIVCRTWMEATLTYSSRPAPCGPPIVFLVNGTGMVTVDLTQVVGAWLDNNLANAGVVVSPGETPADVIFDSKENTATGQAPRLEITLGRAAGPAGPTGSAGPLGPAGPQGPPVPAATATCSNGAALGDVSTSGAPICQCPPAVFQTTATSYFSGAFSHQIWSGQSRTLSQGGCSVKVNAPSDPVDYTSYDIPSGWYLSPATGWRNCSVMALKPDCGAPGGVGSLVNGDFPSCSAALGGNQSSATAYVFCH
jgi:hypothetical protein